jgi:quercetin dioxygenase-like cupin family protein
VPVSARGFFLPLTKDSTVIEPESDPRPLAVPTKQVEDERFIVTEWRFAPGSHTGWHRHAYDYVIVPMTTGTLHLETAGGPASGNLVVGTAYSRQAGVEHDVINDNPYEFVFIEIEAKT